MTLIRGTAGNWICVQNSPLCPCDWFFHCVPGKLQAVQAESCKLPHTHASWPVVPPTCD